MNQGLLEAPDDVSDVISKPGNGQTLFYTGVKLLKGKKKPAAEGRRAPWRLWKRRAIEVFFRATKRSARQESDGGGGFLATFIRLP